jgi:hypothetical protein
MNNIKLYIALGLTTLLISSTLNAFETGDGYINGLAVLPVISIMFCFILLVPVILISIVVVCYLTLKNRLGLYFGILTASLCVTILLWHPTLQWLNFQWDPSNETYIKPEIQIVFTQHLLLALRVLPPLWVFSSMILDYLKKITQASVVKNIH